eukprot:5745605-Amphidinium_carterae.1
MLVYNHQYLCPCHDVNFDACVASFGSKLIRLKLCSMARAGLQLVCTVAALAHVQAAYSVAFYHGDRHCAPASKAMAMYGSSITKEQHVLKLRVSVCT